MAERGGGKGFPVAKKKVASKSLGNNQAPLKKKDGSPMEEDGLVRIESSDSESEGFLDGDKLASPKGTEKTSKESGNSGKKSSLDSLKTGGKSSLKTTGKGGKGDWGKGATAYASGKVGGKGGLPRPSTISPLTEVELKLEMDLPKNARVLMDCEAAVILQGIQDSLTTLSDDPSIKMPDSFNKALEYCKSGAKYTNSDSVRQVLDSLKGYGVTDGEICMIGNACPETIEEVYALVPSLRANKHRNELPIREALVNMANFMHT